MFTTPQGHCSINECLFMARNIHNAEACFPSFFRSVVRSISDYRSYTQTWCSIYGSNFICKHYQQTFILFAAIQKGLTKETLAFSYLTCQSVMADTSYHRHIDYNRRHYTIWDIWIVQMNVMGFSAPIRGKP